MQQVTFDALRLALQDSDARVRIEEEVPARIPVIRALSMDGGFLAGQGINLSPNLNCIIGGRGTGNMEKPFQVTEGAPRLRAAPIF